MKKINIFTPIDFRIIIMTFVGSFCSIGLLAYGANVQNWPTLVASFGASAVLLFGAPTSPLAQPRNLFGGHLISALVGVSIYQLFGERWWSIALAVTLAIIAMMLTATTHPPGGATAMVSVLNHANYSFVFLPILLGAVVLFAAAVLSSRIFPNLREYPLKK